MKSCWTASASLGEDAPGQLPQDEETHIITLFLVVGLADVVVIRLQAAGLGNVLNVKLIFGRISVIFSASVFTVALNIDAKFSNDNLEKKKQIHVLKRY